jgi:hypothetical protein
MKMRKLQHLPALCLALLVATACGPSSDSVLVGGTRLPAPPAPGTGLVFGTVFDLSNGDPADDVEVVLPNGKLTRTDAQGRFQLSNLVLGLEGEVIARATDGRETRLALASLSHERRDIVLHLPAKQ